MTLSDAWLLRDLSSGRRHSLFVRPCSYKLQQSIDTTLCWPVETQSPQDTVFVWTVRSMHGQGRAVMSQETCSGYIYKLIVTSLRARGNTGFLLVTSADSAPPPPLPIYPLWPPMQLNQAYRLSDPPWELCHMLPRTLSAATETRMRWSCDICLTKMSSAVTSAHEKTLLITCICCIYYTVPELNIDINYKCM